jgi:hypothetical protein
MAKLLYQGHASFRLESNFGVVIYVDPFAGKGYDLPGDIILWRGLMGSKAECQGQYRRAFEAKSGAKSLEKPLKWRARVADTMLVGKWRRGSCHVLCKCCTLFVCLCI